MKQSNAPHEDMGRRGAYEEAAIDLAKAIALGAVPFLGQAIDAWDTVESAIRLHREDSAVGREDAQFDLLLAIIGWIPGPGDGVKKSLRIVNRDPQRYASVLFDLLRFVLQECGVKTSPEALLAQVFDSAALRSELDEIIAGVKGSSAFQKLPGRLQSAVLTVLAGARDNMPAMIGIVEKRLHKWKRLQRNSAATSFGSSRPAEGRKPASSDSQTVDGASRARNNSANHARLGQQSLARLTNEGLGVSGEHIADYICAHELGWGKDWDGHDRGADGQWLEGRPSATKMGKLSKGGNPKTPHVLYKLTDGANGTGIDAVWRADPATNNGKLFAIVEAKASKNEDAPKFMRKPAITSRLGVSGKPAARELLEPVEQEENGKTPPLGKTAPNTGKKPGSTPSKRSPTPSAARPATVQVQMSREWIASNLRKTLGESLRRRVMGSYSRHLFYAPLHHPSGSPKIHAQSQIDRSADSNHAEHFAYHYDESEVRAAVNARKKSLARKHGSMASLQVEP